MEQQPPGGEQPQPTPPAQQPGPPPPAAGGQPVPPPSYAPPPPPSTPASGPGGYVPPPPPGYAPPAPGLYQAPPPPGYAPPGPMMTPALTDQMAIWSLVLAGLGLLGLCACGVGGIILGPIAFFMGGSALNRIRASAGALGGDTLASIGRWGGLAVAILGVLILLAFIGLVASGNFGNTTVIPGG